MKRKATVGAAIAAMVMALVGFGAAARPQQAQAFAWKDTCTINVVNRASQSEVRPYGLVQVPPNAVAYALYVSLAATGMPSNTSIGFSNTGIPLTAGCQSILYLYNPGSNVTCHAGAPTVGANHFSCDGNSTFKVTKDNDDIEGTVYVAGRASESAPEAMGLTPGRLRLSPRRASGAEKKPKPQKVAPGILKMTQLSGGGWKKTEEVAELGTFGKLLEASKPSGSCTGGEGKEPTALSGGASLFVRDKGAEAVGELDGRYASVGASKRTLADATSKSSVRCLVQALSASGYRATVAPVGPDFGQGGITTSRVVVKKHGGGFTGYVDVVGLQDGRSNTVLVFFNAGKPAPVLREEETLAAVANGLKP
jgi:hypothetical protein